MSGEYHLRWPEMHWHLHGRYLEFDPGSVLAFTWSWEHEPDAPVTRVRIHFEPQPAGGTLLTITHGPYDDTTGSQEMRAGHIEGWTYFLGRLQDVSASG